MSVYRKPWNRRRIQLHRAWVGTKPAAAGVSYQSTILADTPKAYYRLGEASGNAVDSSGNGYDLSLPVTAPTYGVNGLIVNNTDKAMGFAGATYFQNTGVPDNIGDMSMEAWLVHANIAAAVRRIFSRGISVGWSFGVNASGNYRFTTLGVKDYDFATGPPRDGTTIQHVVFVWRSAAFAIDLYVNGVFRQTVTGTAAMKASTDFLELAGRSSSELWNGTLDEVALYWGALTPTQIANHYAIGSGSKPVVPAGITNNQSVSGSLSVARAIRPTTTVTNTQNVAGSIGRLRPTVPAGISNTQNVAGATVRRVAVKPTGITNNQQVAGAVAKVAAPKLISGIVTNTNTMSGSLRALRQITPASITNTQSMSGAVFKPSTPRPIAPAGITNTNSVTGAVRKLARIAPSAVTNVQTVSGGVTTRPIKVIAPAGITNTQQTSGSVRVARGVRPTTTVTFTNNVSGSLIARRAIKPSTGITNTQNVSGAVSTKPVKFITPTTVTNLNVVGGTITALRLIKPAGVTNAQTVSGNVRVGRGIRPTTQITYTTAVAGSIRKLVVTPTGLTNTNTVTGAVRRLARIAPTTVTFTNSVSGAVTRKLVIRPTTTISNTNTVSGGVLILRGIRPGAITNTNLVSGAVTATKILTSIAKLHPGTIVHPHRGRVSLVGSDETIQLSPAKAEIAVKDRGVLQLQVSRGEVIQ